MLKIVEGLDLKCRVMKTTRGIHVWFKTSEEEPKNFIKNRLAVGIYSDRKSGGRNAYVKIKQDGKKREWIRYVKGAEIQEVPKWLTPISNPSGKFDFKGMGDGSGRNQELFNYIVYLQTKGFTRDEIRETIQVINDYVFADPLPESEIATITRNEAFKSDKDLLSYETGDKFKHNDFGKYLISKYHIVSVEDKLYSYVDNKYMFDPNLIEALCIKELDSITIRNRRETAEYIRITAPKRSFAALGKNG
jgi:putative DNA primase/helicase